MEHLPTLCLPDQSHNFESDSVYFVLPTKEQSEKKVFGELIDILMMFAYLNIHFRFRCIMFSANLNRQTNKP